MNTKLAFSVFAVAALAVIALPTAMSGAHHAGPPDETGHGPGDVTNEPNSDFDKGDPGNGLEQCRTNGFTSCQSPNGTLILDGDYSYGHYPYFVDINSILRQTTPGDGVADSDGDGDTEEFIYPGPAWISAWWGWWNDKGRGETLHETGQTIPGVLSKEADGTVNDVHDNHADHDDSIYTGDYDEFVWRGKNPWAGQTAWDSDLGGKPVHDGATDENGTLLDGHEEKDVMFAFINPGTHHNCCTGGKAQVFNLFAQRDADGAQKPDLRVEDRTDSGPASPGPLPRNNQAYGWLSEFGWWHYQYDASLLMATDITFAVNPPEASGGSYDITSTDTTAVDRDPYSAIHPAVEELYRTTVWDPDESGSASQTGHTGNNLFSDVNEEGPKQEAKDQYANLGLTIAQTDEQIEDARKPLNPAQGAAEDLSGDKARPHEPDTGDESGYAMSGTDNSGATYGNLDGASGYYNADGAADYSSYAQDFEPWMDGQAWMADAQFLVQVRGYGGFNAFPFAASGDAADRSAGPGLLWTSVNLGAWNDVTGDTWIGNLDEVGRTTDPGYPYADGRVDDPNDYEDTAKNTDADPVKQDDPEFKGAGDASSVTATLCPLGPDEYDPSTGCPADAPWGTTEPPAGVYILSDPESDPQKNPYDNVVRDVVGPVGPVGDDERLSRHVQYGPIETQEFNADTTGTDGGYQMVENVVLPTGSLTYPITIRHDATIGEDLSQKDGTPLSGSQISDVDYLIPAE